MIDDEIFSRCLANVVAYIQDQVAAHFHYDLAGIIMMVEYLDLRNANAWKFKGTNSDQKKGTRVGLSKKNDSIYPIEEEGEGTSEVAFTNQKGNPRGGKSNGGKKKEKGPFR